MLDLVPAIVRKVTSRSGNGWSMCRSVQAPFCERLGNTWIFPPWGVRLWLGYTAGPRAPHIPKSSSIHNTFCFFCLRAYPILYKGRLKLQTERKVKWKIVYEVNSSSMPPGSEYLQMQRDGRSRAHNLLVNRCTLKHVSPTETSKLELVLPSLSCWKHGSHC